MVNTHIYLNLIEHNIELFETKTLSYKLIDPESHLSTNYYPSYCPHIFVSKINIIQKVHNIFSNSNSALSNIMV
jgi:exonuclease I